MITERADAVLWQATAAAEAIPEPAIVVNGFEDVLELKQGKAEILINYESVPELITLLRRVVRQHRPMKRGGRHA